MMAVIYFTVCVGLYSDVIMLAVEQSEFCLGGVAMTKYYA